MKKLILPLMLTLIFCQSYSQDLIVTNKGDSLKCKITKLKSDYIYFSFNNNGNTANSLLPRADVVNYSYGYFNTGDNNSSPGASSVDYQKFTLSLDFGYSRRLAKTADNVPSAYRDYINKLKNGYHFGGDFAYYFSEVYGLGGKALIYKASNSEQSYTNNYGKDDITISFIGLMYPTRFIIDDKNSFLINYSIGYMGYTDKWETKTGKGTYTGSTLGYMIDFSYNYSLSKSTALGIRFALIAGSLSEFVCDDGHTKTTVKLDKGEYEGLGRMDISVGLRFGK